MPAGYTPPPTSPASDALDPGLLRDVAIGAARLTGEQALDLYTRTPLFELGRWADARCRSLHGDHLRTYVIDRNINYTNVCSAKCTFCAFRRDGDEADAYTLEYEQLYEKVAELQAIGGTQILMQGGMNPELPLDWYLELLRGLKERFPDIHVHGFSPPEFIEFVRFFDPPGATLEDKLRWVMVRLKEAGLDSLPGGGGEIFAYPVRRKIGLGKCTAEDWLTTMYVAHTLGMFTSATMMFGHIEGAADRVHHMLLVREWQDRILREASASLPRPAGEGPGEGSEAPSPPGRGCHGAAMTGEGSGLPSPPGRGWPSGARSGEGQINPHSPSPHGHYKAFISWPFQRENTPLGRLKEWGQREGELDQPFPGDLAASIRGDGDPKAHPEFGRRLRMAGATDYLRTQALSRLVLDNVYSIGASWVTMGPHIGQTALFFGANDMGSVMMEENVVSSAGTTYCLDEAVLCRLIRTAGFTPAQRDNVYDILRVHDTTASPDLKVNDWSEHRTKRLHIESKAEVEAKVALSVTAGT